MLECKDISLKAGDKQLFEVNSLQLDKGLYALVGRNGSGKSTFLNSILGQMAVNGSITVDGKAIGDFELNELAKSVSIVRSKPMLYGDYSAFDILMLGRLPYQNLLAQPKMKDKAIISDVAKRLGIQDLLKQEYNLLSDGEKQLVMVGRAFVQDTGIILLDEPSAFLDLVNRQELLKHLKRLAIEKNKLIIFSTHHVEILSQYCDGVMLINNGKLNLLTETDTYFDHIAKAFGIGK